MREGRARHGFSLSSQHGTSRTGIFHWKAIIIDAKVMFMGGSNITYASRHSRDSMLRLVGPPVSEALAALEEAKLNAKASAV